MDNVPVTQNCKNGHPQPLPLSRFCIYCGVSVLAVMPASPPTVQPNIVNNPADAGALPHSQPNPAPQQLPQPVQQPQYIRPQFQPARRPPVPEQPRKRCSLCGGTGYGLDSKIVICSECKWLRPLSPGYAIDVSAFQWAEDGKAMSALRAIKPLNMAAEYVSERIGRRWIESLFNGVLLGEKQLPDVYYQAVRAARILGLSYMPDVYVSGEMMWDCKTYGTDKDSFIIIGSALATNFRGPELLFLFAREMGHCRTGHALWKTVIKFLMGEQGPKKGLMGGGLFAALSPTALIEGTLEIPLLAWARQAEITADRAGMLVIGDENIARRVLLTWSLKSPLLFRQVSVESWLEQQAESDDGVTKLSEIMTSATPYITRRLKLVDKFASSPELARWKAVIREHTQKADPHKAAKKTGDIRMKCAACGAAMRVPTSILEGKTQLSIRCPDVKCGKLTYIKKSVKSPPDKISKKDLVRNMSYDE